MNSKIQNLILITYTILFTAILYYRDFAIVDFSKMYLALMTFATAAVLDYKRIICMLCFIFPLSCGIPGNYIYPLLIILLVVKDKNFHPKKLAFFAIIFILEIIHYGFYEFNTQLADVVGYASFLFMLSYIVSDNSKDLDHAKCLTYFCIGTGVLLLAIVINTNILMSQIEFVDEGIRLGNTKDLGDFEEERMMLTTNANTIGYYSIAAISCLLVLQYYRRINPILFIVLFAMAFYGGVLSVSRTWAVLMVISIIFYLITQQKDRVKGVLLICVICLGISIFLSENPLVLDSFVERFTGDTTNLATAGNRTNILKKYNEYLTDNPIMLLMGTGAVYYNNITQISEATHNATQQIIVSYGITGLIIFIYALLKCIKKYFDKRKMIAIMPLLMTIIFIQSIQILNPAFLMCPIIVAFSALKINNSKPV